MNSHSIRIAITLQASRRARTLVDRHTEAVGNPRVQLDMTIRSPSNQRGGLDRQLAEHFRVWPPTPIHPLSSGRGLG